MLISNLQRCYYQNSGIIESLNNHGVLELNQIKIMHYKHQALRTCQDKMQRLTKQGKVKRERKDYNSPYYYFLKKMEQAEHVIAINWVYLWIKENLRNWESIEYWEMQKRHGEMVPDGFIGIRNIPMKNLEFKFIELDIAESGNEFNKVPQYIDYWYQRQWRAEWWAKEAADFPDIIIVTTTLSRLKKINKLIDQQNKEKIVIIDGIEKKVKLNFDVYLLSDLKKIFERFLRC